MTEQLKSRLLEILTYFKEELSGIEAGLEERQPMQDEIEFALPLVEKMKTRENNTKNMLKPKIVQVPDFSDYIGKEFIVKEDSKMSRSIFRCPILKGVTFKIIKFKKSKVTIKITNSTKKLKEIGMLKYDFKGMVKNVQSDIENLNKVLKMWNEEADKFIVDEDSFWNKNHDGDGRGHCINTGYNGIPYDHTGKSFGMAKARYVDGKCVNGDTIMTLDYNRVDDVKNIYSYQAGENTFYNKECYEFILMGKQEDLKCLVEENDYYTKMITKWILEKTEISIDNLNKIKFETK